MRLNMKLSIVCLVIVIVTVILISFNIPVDKDSNKCLGIYYNSGYLFIEPSSAVYNNNDINLTNLLQNTIFRLYYLYYYESINNNYFFTNNPSKRTNKISRLNILFHIQRNHLHIARLKAG